ncbi:MAG: nickel pincer cofactor biosynthesis protein LarC [Promethearchaeota archaeon]
MRLIYIDLQNSGISGDIFLAALLGLVPEYHNILGKLEGLKNIMSDVVKLDIELNKSEVNGIQVNQMNIEIKEGKNHRTAKNLQKALSDFLENLKISTNAKKYAFDVLNSLISAEAQVHGELIKKIHLHELSSVDTLVDIIGVALAIDSINGFDKDFKICCSKIPLGGGQINTTHGILAVPAPATLKILEESNLITYGGPIESELVTPTGAALLTNLYPKVLNYTPDMKIIKTVYSTGQKKFKDFPNVLRLFYGELQGIRLSNNQHPLENFAEKVTVLETDIDDVTGEIIGNFISNLEKTEILDVQVFPTITKKNRPGYKLEVLCYPEHTFKLIEKIIYEIGTLGVRFNIINRICIAREFEKRSIEINYETYEVNYKVSYFKSEQGIKVVNIKPEYEDLKKISDTTKLAIKQVQLLAQSKIKEIYDKFGTND